MYDRTYWQDHVLSETNLFDLVKSNKGPNAYSITPRGTVMQQGTYQDAAHFNKVEETLISHEIAVSMLIAQALQNRSDIGDITEAVLSEIGSVTLNNTGGFPFNNSKKTVALKRRRKNANYTVVAEIAAHTGNVGEIEITDILNNGFKIAYTGSAPSVTINYKIVGGFVK